MSLPLCSEPEKVPLFKEEQLFEFMGMQFNKSEGRNGRVLYDYDAPGEDQIAVEAGQVWPHVLHWR